MGQGGLPIRDAPSQYQVRDRFRRQDPEYRIQNQANLRPVCRWKALDVR